MFVETSKFSIPLLDNPAIGVLLKEMFKCRRNSINSCLSWDWFGNIKYNLPFLGVVHT